MLARRSEAFPLRRVGVDRREGESVMPAKVPQVRVVKSTGCDTKQAVISIDRLRFVNLSHVCVCVCWCVCFHFGFAGACFRRAPVRSLTTRPGERWGSLGPSRPGRWSRGFAPSVLSKPRRCVTYGTRGLKMAPPPTLALGGGGGGVRRWLPLQKKMMPICQRGKGAKALR